MADLVIGILIASVASGVVIKMVKDKKEGKGCCGGCSGCKKRGSCGKEDGKMD